jgi:ribonucleoside-diphosphate reductase alpha chain
MAGLTIPRVFSDINPFNQVTWEKRTAEIKAADGSAVFRQENVEVPVSWSQLATNIVASKYFYGEQGTTEREDSVRQVVDRVVSEISAWGQLDGYFSYNDIHVFYDELSWLCLNQYGSFNSPVWFNVGVYDKPASSACFIQGVEDNMESIMDLAKSEAMLFKGGSGTGTDLTPLRSSKEKLTGGGKPSGPVSFMKVYDTIGGVVKSGGKNRRAARMQTLSVSHPDIMEFIECKVKEERKAKALIAAGYDADFNGEAYSTVAFQNTNISVRVTDEFIESIKRDAILPLLDVKGNSIDYQPARNIMQAMAESAWECGDPGIQYHDTINSWHTVPNTSMIASSNPCSEYMFINDSACNLASLNLMKFRKEDGSFDVERFRAAVRIFIIAMDILIDRSSYPTEKIAQNSRDFRPLGLGYANLGAYVMSLGLPYDSDEARNFAAYVTANMTGQAYLTSTEIAGVKGPFTGYLHNQEPMRKVLEKHRLHAGGLDSLGVSYIWREVYLGDQKNGCRNAQVTVLAPCGCAIPGTLVLTDKGLRRLGSLGDIDGAQWQETNFKVQTDSGPQEATKFYINGVADVVTIETKHGYRFTGTPGHKIRIVDKDGSWQWKMLCELDKDDVVPIKLGGMIGDPIPVKLPSLGFLHFNTKSIAVPKEMTRELSELIGAFMANGSLHEKGLRISVFGHDRELISRTVNLFSEVFGLVATVSEDSKECVSVYANSVPMRKWWEDCGFAKIKPSDHFSGKGHEAHIPSQILETNDPLIYAAFLRGVIDHDGTVAEGCPEFMNVSRDFIEDLKVVALALGFPTGLRSVICGISGNPLWRARLLNRDYVSRWIELIGFTEDRKRANCRNPGERTPKGDIVFVSQSVLDDSYENISQKRAMTACVKRTRGITRKMARSFLRNSGSQEIAHSLGFYFDKIDSVRLQDKPRMTYDLSVPSNVTWIGGGFVSHNTISFMMDCDTTGIEPELALVKYKSLAGGGSLKIVNQTVLESLKSLGYQDKHIERIVSHLCQNDEVFGCSELKEKDYPVFDCAFPDNLLGRSIAPSGHLKMMAAVQPFLSGAISKTINMPHDATVEDIKEVYMEGWRLGLKSLSVYRDGSKGSQPLNTKKEEKSSRLQPPLDKLFERSFEKNKEGYQFLAEGNRDKSSLLSLDSDSGKITTLEPKRIRLPMTRKSITHKFDIQGHEGYIHVGMYDDGRPGEMFITMSKQGSTVSGLMDALATSVSISLQYGIPLSILTEKLKHTRYDPCGFTKNTNIPIASSICDYIFRWMEQEFDKKEVEKEEAEQDQRMALFSEYPELAFPTVAGGAPIESDAPLCDVCGSLTERNGTCYRCRNCGNSLGCS